MLTTMSTSENSKRCGTSAARSFGPMSGSVSIIEKIRSMTSRNSLGELELRGHHNAPSRLTRLSYTFSCTRARTSSPARARARGPRRRRARAGRPAAARRRRSASARAPAAPAAAAAGAAGAPTRAMHAVGEPGPAGDERAGDDRRAAAQRELDEAAVPEALEAIAPRVARPGPAPALGEAQHQVPLGEQALGVAGRRGHAAEPAQRRRGQRQLERAAVDEEARRVVGAHVVAAQRGGEHRRVPRLAAGLVGDDQGRAAGRDVLEAVGAHAPPARVERVEQRRRGAGEVGVEAPVVLGHDGPRCARERLERRVLEGGSPARGACAWCRRRARSAGSARSRRAARAGRPRCAPRRTSGPHSGAGDRQRRAAGVAQRARERDDAVGGDVDRRRAPDAAPPGAGRRSRRRRPAAARAGRSRARWGRPARARGG